MRYKNYIFDLYGTLADIRTDEEKLPLWEQTADLLASAGAVYRPDALRQAYFRTVGEEEERLRRETGLAWPEIRLETVFARLIHEAPEGPGQADAGRIRSFLLAFRTASREKLALFPDALPLLRKIRAEGAGLYLLSNAQAVFTREELFLLGLSGAFDAVYLSSDCGMKKPQPEFMRLLLRERGLKKEECVMVGNDPFSDGGAAGSCGVDFLCVPDGVTMRNVK